MEESESPIAGHSSGTSQAVYTDIDGTVTAYNTIFEFLRFDAGNSRKAEAEEFLEGLRAAARNGVPRSVTNARYFSWWRGRRVGDVQELGERWADVQAGSPDDWSFLEPVTSLLDKHTAAGRRLVAVTASFEPALLHVRRRWPNLELLCTRPLLAGDSYTGEIEGALVGEAKAEAVLTHAAEHGVDLSASFAYGDHSSDLQFMALAGQSLLVTTMPQPAVVAG